MNRSVLQAIVDVFDKIAADDMDLELPAAQMIVDRLCLEGYVLVEKAEYDRLVALEDR